MEIFFLLKSQKEVDVLLQELSILYCQCRSRVRDAFVYQSYCCWQCITSLLYICTTVGTPGAGEGLSLSFHDSSPTTLLSTQTSTSLLIILSKKLLFQIIISMASQTKASVASAHETNGQGDPSKGVYRRTNMGWIGAGPWPYRLLEEPYLSRELERQCNPKVYLSEGKEGRPVAYSASIQPSLDPVHRSQDRCTAELWNMPNGPWTMAAVFDGECQGICSSAYFM